MQLARRSSHAICNAPPQLLAGPKKMTPPASLSCLRRNWLVLCLHARVRQGHAIAAWGVCWLTTVRCRNWLAASPRPLGVAARHRRTGGQRRVLPRGVLPRGVNAAARGAVGTHSEERGGDTPAAGSGACQAIGGVPLASAGSARQTARRVGCGRADCARAVARCSRGCGAKRNHRRRVQQPAAWCDCGYGSGGCGRCTDHSEAARDGALSIRDGGLADWHGGMPPNQSPSHRTAPHHATVPAPPLAVRSRHTTQERNASRSNRPPRASRVALHIAPGPVGVRGIPGSTHRSHQRRVRSTGRCRHSMGGVGGGGV